MSNDRELLKALEALKEKETENQLAKFRPYDCQLPFLNDTTHKVRALIAGNQCLSGDTMIFDPVAGIERRLDEIDEDFHVWSWDGSKAVIAKARKPVKKGPVAIRRVHLAGGEYFDCSEDHLVLGPSGWTNILEHQQGFSAVHPQTNLGNVPSALKQDVLRCSRIVQDFLSGYRHGCRSCDGPPQMEEGVCRDVGPLQDGAPECSHIQPHCSGAEPAPSTPLDDPYQPRYLYSRPCQSDAPQSNEGALDQIEAPFFDSVSQTWHRLRIPVWDLLPTHPLFADESCPEQSSLEADLLASRIFASLCVVVSSRRLPITSIDQLDYLRNDFVYDIEVEGYNNYIHAGVLHHNCGKTYTVSYEVACHVTGLYPPWWRGIRYVSPIDVWIAGVTAVRVRDTVQEKLFGRLGRIGTGMIPKHLIVQDTIIKKTGTPYAFDRVEIKHLNGGCSTIQFFSYDQGMEKFMGSTIDLAWFDEEPPADINAEVKMRLIVKDGILLYSFTPLQGVTPLYDSIMQDDNVLKVRISQSQVPHLDKQKIDRALEGLSESEKQARRDGVATIGAGKVFQFEEHEYTCEPFEIPPYWRRLGGFDVGLGHPTGAVAAAIDDDSKTVYIYNEYKVNEKTAVEIASHLRHWGLKFMADPSVFSREIATAQSKSLAYTDEGMELIKGNRDREEGIHIMRKYFGSGRLWIFDTCQDLLKELRTYRTKTSADGHTVVVKVDDDVVDALRYCIMGIEEYAEVPQKYKNPVRVKTFKPADPKVGY